MPDYQIIPIERTHIDTSGLILPVQLEEISNHQWHAWIESSPDCASSGFSKEEALSNLKLLIKAYIDLFIFCNKC
jgi:hypothetical protein